MRMHYPGPPNKNRARQLGRWAWTLSLLTMFASCGDAPDVVDCCVDRATVAILEGSVRDGLDAPVQSARVATTGLRYECERPEEPRGPGSGHTVSDASGRFAMSVSSFLGSPGRYCVDLVVSGATLQAADTTVGVALTFYWPEATDTTRIVVQVGG